MEGPLLRLFPSAKDASNANYNQEADGESSVDTETAEDDDYTAESETDEEFVL